MSIIDRVKRALTRKSHGFTERPKAKTVGRYTGRTMKARIGRHKRVQVGLVDIANVCPVCAGLPVRLSSYHLASGQSTDKQIYTCANQHTWGS